MPRSYTSSVIGADPDTVWDFLRDFNRTPDFVDAVTASEILDGKPADQVGCERKLTLNDGSLVRERLVALSDLDRSYTYHLLEGPFPFTRYYSTIRVSPVTQGARASSNGGARTTANPRTRRPWTTCWRAPSTQAASRRWRPVSAEPPVGPRGRRHGGRRQRPPGGARARPRPWTTKRPRSCGATGSGPRPRPQRVRRRGVVGDRRPRGRDRRPAGRSAR
ncbi:SRPBCC family protein [Geodermatophilus siccatus]|uniref:SRPBCC family protein n=1 Tax=Geodermatophilus siccatus TaxID=1137991 RepID=UPI000B89E8BC